MTTESHNHFKMIIDLLEFSSTEIFHTSKRLTDQQMLISPGEGKWNIAQIIQHLHLSDRGARFAMMRQTEPCDRDPLELINAFEEKRKVDANGLIAPEKVIPSDHIEAEELEKLKLDFISTRREIVEFLKKEDPSLLCTAFAHPRIGMLTRIEWAKFIDWHGRHHHKQIHNILMYTPGTFPAPNIN